jgi:hypothetical protein
MFIPVARAQLLLVFHGEYWEETEDEARIPRVRT